MANNTTVNTANKDVDYIVKDYSSTIDALISYANINFGPGTSANRLWTNFNADSFSRNWLEIVAYISDIFFFYFDNQATQSYLQTATIRSAVKDIAKQFGFVPATASSASGTATFTFTGTGTLPRGFKVRATNGAEFYLTNAITVIAPGQVNGTVLQGTIVSETFTAEGFQDEEFDLSSLNVIRDLINSNTQDISPQITVNGNDYTLVDTFIRNTGEDTAAVYDSLGNVVSGGRVFTLNERPDGTPYIRFGDGIFGRKLSPGETIVITYRTGGGTIGNIPEETLTTLVSSSSIVSSVINNAEFSGGADEQSIEQLRELIPASLRTLDRAVAEQDYSDILIANFSEVFSASTEKNGVDVGIDLNIYVVPQGNGIPQISDNPILKNKLSDFLDRRKTVTVQFQLLDAFGISSLIGLEVFISNTASRTTVSQSVNSALEEFFSLSTGGVSGSGIGFAENILLKDIGNVIEEISGVERFEIKQLSYKPRIEENILGFLTSYSSSEVTIFPNVEEREWLYAASGPITEISGTVLFSNTDLTAFTYTSGTGVVQFSFPVDLTKVAPSDQFRDGTLTDFTILAVDTVNNNLTLSTGLTINNTVTLADHGSIRNGSTSYESFKMFKKIRAIATNLSTDSLTDTNLDLSVISSTGTAIGARILLDNNKVFVPNQHASGEFYLGDSSGAIWEIEENDSNTLKTSITAVNDASITSVSTGSYKIVNKLIGAQALFNGNIFNIQYNNANTIFAIGSQFSQIGTIGDEFAISTQQANVGRFGVALDLVSYNSGTGDIRLNSAPDLQGISSDYVLIDSDGQIFNVVGCDNRAKPAVFYDSSNQNGSFLLEDSGLGFQISQGFKVSSTDSYAIVSFNLQREGNIVGNLTAKIVNDSGGLPNLSSVVAISNPVSISDISLGSFEKVVFNFTSPPSLTAAIQYHLVLSGDVSYSASEISGVKSFDNTGLIGFSYDSFSGVISFSSTVNLSSVVAGHYFRDGSGNLFLINSVNDADDEIILDDSLTINNSVTTNDDGSIYIYDRILVGTDVSFPAYADGEFSRFDGTNWSNSTLGPSPSGINTDTIFSIEGTKTITIESNLTPVMGPNATVSTRYYDDDNQISFITGLSSGYITSATDANALGRGTISGDPNRKIDNFVFRTSRYADDIVNLRLNELPQIEESDININIFGGIE